VKLPRFFGGSARDEISGLENPSVDLIAAIVAHSDGSTSASVSMSPLKAFRLAAVYACVRVVASSIASLPIDISRADETGDGRDIVRDDPRSLLLNDFPNPEMTGMELIENWIAHAMLWGSGYLYIVRDGAGRPVELWPLMPDTTKPVRLRGTNELAYETEIPSTREKKTLPAASVIPIHAVMGISPTMNSRDMLATAWAAQSYAGQFWKNNARPGGIIELPEDMDDDGMDEFLRRWKAGHEGLKRAQLVGILTAGAKWTDVGISPAMAQFLETRQYAAKETAMMYGVPPHRIGIVEPGNSRQSLEQQAIEFISFTLREWSVRAEQAFRTKLFNSKTDLATRTYPKFNFVELQRGDIRSRYEAYAIGVQWGFLSRGDVRRFEGLSTVGNEELLEEFLVPLNMIPSSKLDQVEVGSAKDGGGGDNNKDGGGTQPTTGSDGSKPQIGKNAAAFELLAGILRDDPELADAVAMHALRRAQRALPPAE
jgi:HK97 family phage portal protein